MCKDDQQVTISQLTFKHENSETVFNSTVIIIIVQRFHLISYAQET